MDRAFVRDLQEALTLFVTEVALEANGTLDSVDITFRILDTLLAVVCVDAVLAKSNTNLFEWPLLATRVKSNCHRHATAERC